MQKHDREILIFEPKPFWTPEMQRQFDRTDISASLCSSTANILQKLNSASAQVIILPLEHSATDCLNLMRRLFAQEVYQTIPAEASSTTTAPTTSAPSAATATLQFVTPHIIVLASQAMAELECPFRELGAGAFVIGHITGTDLASLCRRHWWPFGAGRR